MLYWNIDNILILAVFFINFSIKYLVCMQGRIFQGGLKAMVMYIAIIHIILNKVHCKLLNTTDA